LLLPKNTRRTSCCCPSRVNRDPAHWVASAMRFRNWRSGVAGRVVRAWRQQRQSGSSRDVTVRINNGTIIHDNDLLPILYKRRWDAAAKRWNVTNPDKVPPCGREADTSRKTSGRYRRQQNRIGIAEHHVDRSRAAQTGQRSCQADDAYLRDRAIEEADRNVAYLRAEIQEPVMSSSGMSSTR